MRLKIISDGTYEGTGVFNAETNESIEGIEAVVISISNHADVQTSIYANNNLLELDSLEVTNKCECEDCACK